MLSNILFQAINDLKPTKKTFMKLFSSLSIIRGIGYLLVFILCMSCKKDHNSTDPSQLPSESISQSGGGNVAAAGSILSQTSTGNVFNNLVPPTQWLQANPQYFLADDNSYAISKKLSRARGSIPIILQDFRFDIPSNAIIESIVVSARRFKTGKGSVADHAVHLVTRRDPNPRGYFGVIFRNSNLIPGIETEISYTQNGTDDNGGLPDEFGNYDEYQWTPAMINDPAFGVWFTHGQPNGSLVVYYDQVKITVYYSLPEVVAP